MDGFKEKKWFVYVADHHEGPFSLEEIQGKMAVGQILKTYYVWADGMKDWKPMTEVGAFEGLFSVPTSSTALAAKAIEQFENDPPAATILAPTSTYATEEPSIKILSPAAAMPVEQSEPTFEVTPVLETPVSTFTHPTLSSAREEPVSTPSTQQPLQSAPSKKKAMGRGFFKWAVVIIFVLGVGTLYYGGFLTPGLVQLQDAVQPMLIQLTDKIPALSKIISPIPTLEDVTPEDMLELKAAANGLPEKVGARAAIALSQTDIFTPTFYIASNLPDGTVLEVYVQGIDETLLNQTSYTTQGQVTLLKKMAKTQPIHNLDGKTLTRGEYMFYLVASNSNSPQIKPMVDAAPAAAIKVPAMIPSGAKVLSAKSYFLGGRKDAIYTARLKEYHDKLGEEATQELVELKQISLTLENQLADTSKKFSTLANSGSKTPKAAGIKRRFWNDFSQKWMALSAQMAETFKADKLYATVYQLAQQSALSIGHVHELQTSFLNNPTDRASFDIQLGEASSQAQSMLINLKAKIEQAEKMPPTPNGMPKREGL